MELFWRNVLPQVRGKYSQRRVLQERCIWPWESEDNGVRVGRRNGNALPINPSQAFNVGVLSRADGEKHVSRRERNSIMEGKIRSKRECVRRAVFRYLVRRREVGDDGTVGLRAHEPGVHQLRDIAVRLRKRQQRVYESSGTDHSFGKRAAFRGDGD